MKKIFGIKTQIIVAIIVLIIAIFFGIKSIDQAKMRKNAEERIVEYGNGGKINTSEVLRETKKTDKFEIKDIQLTYEYGLTIFLGTAINVSNSRTEMANITIYILDEKGKTLNKFEGILPELDSGESITMNYSLDMEIPLAYDLKLEINEIEQPIIEMENEEIEKIEEKEDEEEVNEVEEEEIVEE